MWQIEEYHPTYMFTEILVCFREVPDMGKAWKRRERPAPVSEVPGDYKWSSQSYTLKDILNNFKLPVVVQCRDDTNAEHLQVQVQNAHK